MNHLPTINFQGLLLVFKEGDLPKLLEMVLESKVQVRGFKCSFWVVFFPMKSLFISSAPSKTSPRREGNGFWKMGIWTRKQNFHNNGGMEIQKCLKINSIMICNPHNWVLFTRHLFPQLNTSQCRRFCVVVIRVPSQQEAAHVPYISHFFGLKLLLIWLRFPFSRGLISESL